MNIICYTDTVYVTHFVQIDLFLCELTMNHDFMFV